QSPFPEEQHADWGCLYSHNFSLTKKLYEQIGGFDGTFEGCGGEDVELGYRLQQFGARFVIARDAVRFHQYHPRSAERWVSNMANIERIAAKHPELVQFRNQVVAEWRQKNSEAISGQR